MSIDARSLHDRQHDDRIPPKHDAQWTLGLLARRLGGCPADRASRHLEFDQRTTVIMKVTKPRFVYLILEGAVMVSKLLPDGRRQIIELLGSGDVFGITTTSTHDSCAETLRPTRILCYDRKTIDGSHSLQSLITERMKAQIGACD